MALGPAAQLTPGGESRGLLRCTECIGSLQRRTRMGMLQGEAFAHVPQAFEAPAVAGTEPPQPLGSPG